MPNKVTQFVQLLRSTGRERRLGTLIFFITSRCNAKCETCFYHEELNRPGDLTFEQIESLLGFTLPDEARTDPAWWANDRPADSHTQTWTLARRTAKPNLHAETVAFERAS
jgi:hypothetical protein